MNFLAKSSQKPEYLPREYGDCFNDLFPILVDNNLLHTKEPLNNGMIWNGNLYLSLDKDYNPVIHGFIKFFEDSPSINVKYTFKSGKWVKLKL